MTEQAAPLTTYKGFDKNFQCRGFQYEVGKTYETDRANRSAATNTGNRSAATNTGNRSAATNTGNRSAASVEGKYSVAIATGGNSKAKASAGSAIVLVYRNDDGKLLHIRAAIAGAGEIKPDTWYSLNDLGEFVEMSQ